MHYKGIHNNLYMGALSATKVILFINLSIVIKILFDKI